FHSAGSSHSSCLTAGAGAAAALGAGAAGAAAGLGSSVGWFFSHALPSTATASAAVSAPACLRMTRPVEESFIRSRIVLHGPEEQGGVTRPFQKAFRAASTC